MAIGDLSFAIDTSKNETPQTVARKRALAEAILGETSHAPRDIGEGLNSLGQAIMYRRLMKGVTGAEDAGNSGASKVFQSLFGDQFPAAPVPSAAPPVTPDASTVPPTGDHPVPPANVGSASPSAGNDYFSAIRSAESGGSDTAKNPTSSATGRYQFTTGTWGDVAAAHPELGLTPEGRLDPAQQERAIRAFTADNANQLSGAGIPTTGGNLYAAHFLGATGAQNVLTQPDSSPIAAHVSPAVVQANPFLASMNVGQFKQWAARHGGGNAPVDLGGNSPQLAGLPGQAPVPQDAPIQVASNDPTASMGIPYAPAAMPGGLGAIQQQIASQPPMDAKAAIARAMAGQGRGFPAEIGQQDAQRLQAMPRPADAVPFNGPAELGGGNPVVVNAGLWPRGGQRVLDAMMQQQSMTGGAPMGMQAPAGGPVPPQAAQPAPELAPAPMPPQADAGGLAPQQAAPPLPPPTTVQDRPVAPPQAPDLSQLPAMAGGTSDVVAPGSQQGPSVQQLMQAAGDPWVMARYGPLVEALVQQKMKQGDPSYALDLAKKQMDIQLEQQQLGGAFRGDSLDAQAWNILQTRDPNSKEYATAYSIVSQPKNQLVQTPQGSQLIAIPPSIPDWVKAPGAAGAPGQPPASQASPGAQSATPATGGATSGGVIPGTKPAPTEMQARNGAIGRILLNEVPTLGANFKALSDPKGQFLNTIPGGMGNAWQSPEYQQAANAVKASVANVLYSLSGASSNPGEVMNQIGILTPAFGDAPATIDAKLQRFKTYVRAISSEANDPELSKSVEDAISKMDMPAASGQGQQAPSGGPKNKTSSGVEWSVSP